MDEKELIKRGLKKKDLAHRQADRVNHKEMEEKRYGAIKKKDFDKWLRERRKKHPVD